LIGLGDPDAVRAVYRGERQITLRQDLENRDPDTRSGRPRKRTREALAAMDADTAALFEALRAWRRGEAADQAVPPYVIFADRTLQDIARLRPRSRAELLLANGVGDSKADRYGAAVLKVVRDN
jgi:ATP-dependent DNA helicase RecQ